MGGYASPLWVGPVIITVFFTDMSVSGTLLPFFVDDVLHAPVEWVGISITLQYACATVGLVLTGYLADAIGMRKAAILVGAANVIFLNIAGRVRSIGAMLAIRCFLGLANTYALGLTWVAALAPRAQLARWMACAIVSGQASLMVGGLIAGALRGRDLALASGLVSIAPAAVSLYLIGACDTAGGPTTDRHQLAGLSRVVRTRYFWGVAFAPLVQGGCFGGMMQSLSPLVLRSTHGWKEGDIGRLFQAAGLGALIAHATATPYFSSRKWRQRATQALTLLAAAVIVAYGAVGDRRGYAWAAMALPIISFVLIAICLGCVNFMIALLARTIAPESLGTVTGLTRCAFTLGYCSLPAVLPPMRAAGGLILPCALVGALLVLVALLLQLASSLPHPPEPRIAPEPRIENASSGVVASTGVSSTLDAVTASGEV